MRAQKFVTADQLKTIRDGKRLSIAGLVLIRQRPGSAKGVVFITIEDETGIANLVVWPDVFEKQRKIVMGARLMAVHGIVQRDPDSDVIHVVARRLEDHSHMLRHLSDESHALDPQPGRRRRQLAAARRAPPARRRDHPQKPRFPLRQRFIWAQAERAISASKIRARGAANETDSHQDCARRACRWHCRSPAAAQAAIEGHWTNPKRSVIVSVAPCGDAYVRNVVKAVAKAKANARKGGTPHLIGTRDPERPPAGGRRHLQGPGVRPQAQHPRAGDGPPGRRQRDRGAAAARSPACSARNSAGRVVS